MLKLSKFYFPLFICFLWWFCAEFQLVNSFLLPHPQSVFKAFWVLLENGILLRHISVSLGRTFIGFFFATVTALGLAFLFYALPKTYPFFKTTLQFIQHIPPLAMLTLLILWFGIGESSKLVMIFLASFFPIFINTFNGLNKCDPKLIEVGTVIPMSRKEIFFRILIPATLPYITIGLKLGMVYAWRSLIGAEFIATSTGLGYLVLDARELSRTDIVMVGLLCFGLIGLIIDQLFSFILSKFPYIIERNFNGLH